MDTTPSYTLSCAKEDFKFSSAHFVAHNGGREKLHGHNYRLYVSLQARSLGADGTVMDFAELKKVVRALCKCVAFIFIIVMDSMLCPLRYNAPPFFSLSNAIHVHGCVLTT